MPQPLRRLPRNLHLQMLRCLAASFVVIEHGLWISGLVHTPFAERVAYLFGDTGVLAFFVLSGFLMMRQSESLFGSWRNAVLFLVRRAVRIVPMYWIATLLFALQVHHRGFAHLKQQTIVAMAFLPNLYNPSPYFPLLQPGWTLNYEMFFYVIFACCLLLPRRLGVAVLLTVLLLLAVAPIVHPTPAGGAAASIVSYYVNLMLMPFAGGVGLALAEKQILARTTFRMPVPPALALIVPVAVLPWLPWGVWDLRFWLLRCAMPIGVVLICILGRPAVRGFERALVVLGDASYSTYLFHIFLLDWIQSFVVRVAHGKPISMWAVCAAQVVAANLLGLAIHFALERPLTRALGNKNIGPAWFKKSLLRPNLGV